LLALRIFIASPGGLNSERQRFRDLVYKSYGAGGHAHPRRRGGAPSRPAVGCVGSREGRPRRPPADARTPRPVGTV